MRVGRVLLLNNDITEEQLKQGLRKQREEGGLIGSTLIELGYIDEKTLIDALSKSLDVEGVILSEYPLDDEVLNLITPEVAKAYGVVPLKRAGKKLYMAMTHPKDVQAIEDLRFKTGYEIKPFVAADIAVREVLKEHYETKALEEEVMENIDLEVVDTGEEEEETASDIAAQVDSGPVVEYVNYLLKKAVEEGASDLHIEPYEKEVRVRLRVDGVLHNFQPPPWKLHKAVVSRIKVISDLKVQEKRRPQDGRFQAQIRGRRIDFRVSTIPTIFGEKVALRILDSESIDFDLSKLGFEEKALKRTRSAIKKPHGIILVTGPTGSGKTTTLYSMLKEINEVSVNVSTAEDPVEYTLPGINQLQVREGIGLTFVSALKAFLRQDPDIIMVGEIRDKATTEIAIRSALTGHLVLSTVHTNSASATVTRLTNMGVQPFLLASTFELIVSQRLVRRICERCKTSRDVSKEELIEWGIDPRKYDIKKVYYGTGCDSCKDTGYSGRIGLFEALPMSSKIKKMIVDEETSDEIEKQAINEGMNTLRMEGIQKVIKGETTVEEVNRETLER